MYWLPYSSHTSLHPHRLPIFVESLMLLKNWCSIHARWSKTVWSIPYFSVALSPSLKHNFIAYRSSKVSNCIFEIHRLWQSGVWHMAYSNCCCSCWFEPEILKIGQSSHKMYSNNILYFQESTTILDAHTKKVLKIIICTSIICLIHKWNCNKKYHSGSKVTRKKWQLKGTPHFRKFND